MCRFKMLGYLSLCFCLSFGAFVWAQVDEAAKESAASEEMLDQMDSGVGAALSQKDLDRLTQESISAPETAGPGAQESDLEALSQEPESEEAASLVSASLPQEAPLFESLMKEEAQMQEMKEMEETQTAEEDGLPSDWLWGEVVSVDPQKPQLVIKHLDYDTYEEVQKTLVLTPKTLYENVQTLSEISPGDNVTVDYKKKEDAELIVGMIVVEKNAVVGTQSASEGSGQTPAAESVVAPGEGEPPAAETAILSGAEAVESSLAVVETPQQVLVQETSGEEVSLASQEETMPQAEEGIVLPGEELSENAEQGQ